MQVVVDNPAKDRKALSAAGFTYLEGTLDQIELQTNRGTGRLRREAGQKDFNIDAAYGSVPKGGKKSALFFSTSRQAGSHRNVLNR